MRKIERAMLDAVRERRNMRQANTAVTVREDGRVEVRLYGHMIGLLSPTKGALTVSNCGFATVTTKSRLNALLTLAMGQPRIHQHHFQWFLGEEEWSGEPITLPA